MGKQYIEIYSGDTLLETRPSVSDYTIADQYSLIAYADGRADRTTVGAGAYMEVSGGTASETIIGNGGIMTVNSGKADDISIRSGGKLILNGAASDITVQPNGTLTVNAGGNGSGIDLFVIGLITVNAGGAIRDVCQHNGTIELYGGKAEGVTVCGGTFLVESGAFADRIVLDQNGVFLNVCSGGHLGSAVCNGAEITVESGGVASGSIVDGYEIDDPFSGIMTVTGGMTLKSGAIHRGTLSITNLGNVIAESGSVIDFTVSQCVPGSTALLSNFSGINGTPDFTMTVTANQAVGVYALANGVSAFSAPVALQCESYSALNLAVGETATYHDRVYSLSLANAELTIDVADYTTSATANQLNWNEINDAVSYAVELSGGSHNIEVEIGTQGADLLGLANGDYTWQVRNSAEVDNRQTGEDFSQTAAPQEPQVLSAETNTLTDVFFANVDGVWGKGFEAMHVGCKDGWTGTLETVNLAGKSRITDIFAGSDDASVLVLTDDSENGMALFVDDIYSAACGTPEQARLSKIDTIYATAWDDIIDLTSQSFEFANGVTVYGGTGNDVIWANSKENTLFGEAGDDRIIGGNEDDVIIGGIGNDTLHGGGGADVFCFGDGWGVDTVEQLATGSVVLWFNENSGTWDETTLTYTQGDNSVSVFGVASVELRFGAAEGHEEQYAVLSASGAFA